MTIAVLHPGEMGAAIAHALREVAAPVAGFTGIYVDANAVSPATSREVGALVPQADFVDGGIFGPPPTVRGSTRLYLGGDSAEMEEIADTFAAAGLPDGFHRAAAEIYRR